jgi:type I restriction enzyme S subunit
MMGSTHNTIYMPDIASLRFVVPPPAEQSAVVSFIDYETAKIDALISEQQRLIELLQEKRQAVISHAVTKGLNPDAPMKDSGIEWLGEVPEHWEVAPLRRLTAPGTTITYGIVQAGPDVEGGIPYIRTSDMSGDELAEDGYLRTSEDIDRSYSRSKVAVGDLVVAIRATLGKGLLVPPHLAGANLTQGTARVSPGDRLLPRFLLRAFNSDFCQTSIDLVAKGSTFREITLDALRRVPMVVPPVAEQSEIVAFVDSRVSDLAALLADTELGITLLQERRSALISAAVTGQIDVRGFGGTEAA